MAIINLFSIFWENNFILKEINITNEYNNYRLYYKIYIISYMENNNGFI